MSNAGENHSDTVFVRRLDDIVVADRAARLDDVGSAALARALDIVAEGEKGVRADGHASLLREPSALFLAR